MESTLVEMLRLSGQKMEWTNARDPKLSHAEALRQSMLAMIDGAKSDAEADPGSGLRLS